MKNIVKYYRCGRRQTLFELSQQLPKQYADDHELTGIRCEPPPVGAQQLVQQLHVFAVMQLELDGYLDGETEYPVECVHRQRNAR